MNGDSTDRRNGLIPCAQVITDNRERVIEALQNFDGGGSFLPALIDVVELMLPAIPGTEVGRLYSKLRKVKAGGAPSNCANCGHPKACHVTNRNHERFGDCEHFEQPSSAASHGVLCRCTSYAAKPKPLKPRKR